MSKEKEAMQMALEWFQWFHNSETIESQKSSTQVKKALEEALAEVQGEAVAWWNGEHVTAVFALKRDTPGIGLRNPNAVPLYAHPAPAQQPLMESEIMTEFDREPVQFGLFAFEAGVRYAEAAHGIGGEN